MTQNLYLGADLAPIFTEPDPIAAANVAYQHMVQTNFPARAQAIATEIVAKHPVLVGLQEVALWKLGPDPAHLETTYDFLAILLAALAAQDGDYQAVAIDVDFSGMLPLSHTFTPWASFTQQDVILARTDLPSTLFQVSNPTSQNFAARLPITVLGQTLYIIRGWSTVDAWYRGGEFRFANTHLEAYNETVRTLQAQELISSLTASVLPVVVTGDFNSRPTDSGGPYGMMTAAGFIDSWSASMGTDPGNTSGQPDSLDCSQPSTIDHRIDLIWYEGDDDIGAMRGDVVGEVPSDCTVGTDPPLWPSDHAGVAMTLTIAA
jgi:endonuclease/exonuclease/phosphatase family metal-dependent hydrolase